MTDPVAACPALGPLLAGWPEGGLKAAFIRLARLLADQPGTRLGLLDRPGVSLSLRAGQTCRQGRAYFALVDLVVDQEPWLSVCFYADETTDPAGLGQVVPQGFLGEDGLCFDVLDDDEGLLAYLARRVAEAAVAPGLKKA
jgi:hypothetical protein